MTCQGSLIRLKEFDTILAKIKFEGKYQTDVMISADDLAKTNHYLSAVYSLGSISFDDYSPMVAVFELDKANDTLSLLIPMPPSTIRMKPSRVSFTKRSMASSPSTR